MFDCIIVGAGPAGAAAAYHLGKQGHSVLILEKQSFPRYKSCGAGVSPAVARWFDFDFTPVIDNTVREVMFTWKMGDPVTVQLETPEPMWMVKRDVFDSFLLDKAKEQGVEFKENCTVSAVAPQGDSWQVTTSQETFTARYLIAADGVKGPMAQWLGLGQQPQHLAMVLEVETPVDSTKQHTAHFDFGALKNTTIWNFPKTDGYSISAAIVGGTKGKVKDLQTALTKYAQQANIDLSKSKFSEYPLHLWSEKQPLHTQNALLVGEAAGIVDPLTAEGIRPAIATGVEAAQAIHQALEGNQGALAQYTETIHQQWGSDFVLAQRLAGLFYKFPKIAYKVGVKRPYASQMMSQILCGQLRYSDVTDNAMKKLKKSLIPGMG